MPRFRDHLTEEDWLRLKEAVREVGQDGPFNANDALWHVLDTSVSNNAGDVAAILADMSDLGYLRALGGDSPRWELVESE